MEIYFVRHTQPLVEDGICYGQTDLALADSFSLEVDQIKQDLTVEFNTVYSSPLKRCKRLAQSLEMNFVIDDRLMEINFGDWEMQRWDQIPKEELDIWMKDYIHVSPPKGESATHLLNRISEFYKSVRSTGARRILIISHLGPIRCFYSVLNNVSLEDAFKKFKLPYGGIFKWPG